MTRRSLIPIGLVVALASTGISTTLATDVVLTHQGRLLDASDQPVTGNVSLTFRIHEAPTGGAPLWTEAHPSVAVEDGLFIEELGVLTPLSVDVLAPADGANPPRWLEIEVDGDVLVPRIRLGATPTAASSKRISGDISTAPGAVRIGGMSGSTTGTIRMVAVHDSAGTIIEHDDDGDGVPESSVSYKTSGPRAGGILSGMSGSTTGTIRMAASPDSTESVMDTDSDGDGVPESSVSSKTRPFKAGSILSGMSGSTTGTIRMTASPDSTESVLGQDSDGDGVPESSVSSKTKGTKATGGYVGGMSGSTTGTIRLAASPDSTESVLDSDSDGDGVSESSVSSKTKGTKATGGYVGGMSGSTTGTIRMAASPDSTNSALDSDINGDGIPESSVKSKTSGPRAGTILSGMSGSTTGTIRMSAAPESTLTILGTDTDGNGVPDNLLIHKSKGTQAGSTFSGMSGSTTGTIRMQAAGSGQGGGSSLVAVDLDTDADGDPEGSSSFECKETRAELKTRFENGEIPTEDNLVQTSCDADGAGVSLRAPKALLTWGTGLAFRVNDTDGPSITMDTDSVPTFTVHDGTGYLSSKLGVGILTPTEKIEVAGGAYCDGTTWFSVSDANSKENFRKVDGEELLQKISDLEITEWNYKGDQNATHIGPTAQDFKRSFGVGRDDKSISAIDPSGIALAAIQALSQKLNEQKAQNDELRAQIAELREMIRAQASEQQ